MAQLADIQGSVFQDGTVTTLARIVDIDNDPVQIADVSSITYTISLVNPDGSLTAVTGHTNVGLEVATVMFDTLQTGVAWTVDTYGYNFLHVVDVSTNDAFSQAGRTYKIQYTLQPTVGQKLIFRYQVSCI
jgi:hypothetical protein